MKSLESEGNVVKGHTSIDRSICTLGIDVPRVELLPKRVKYTRVYTTVYQRVYNCVHVSTQVCTHVYTSFLLGGVYMSGIYMFMRGVILSSVYAPRLHLPSTSSGFMPKPWG